MDTLRVVWYLSKMLTLGFIPEVAASFAYGASSRGFPIIGYQPGTILPLPDSLPLLLMGGTEDANTPVIRTFQEAITGGRNDTYLVILEGANHFSIVDEPDSTIVRSSLDLEATQSQENLRLLMSEIISLFIDTYVRHQPEASQLLDQLLNTANPLIKSFERK